jgi:hypothetical protein
MAKDYTDDFIKDPEPGPSAVQNTEFRTLVDGTVTDLRYATQEQVERTLKNITDDKAFVTKYGSHNVFKFHKEVWDRLEKLRNRK